MSGSTGRSARATSASHAIGKAKTRPGGQQLGWPSKGLLGSPRVERDLVARWPPPPKQLLVSGASRSFGAGEMVVEGAAGRDRDSAPGRSSEQYRLTVTPSISLTDGLYGSLVGLLSGELSRRDATAPDHFAGLVALMG